jgi:succinyl-diaminopimelate desuccinylase
VGAYRDEIVGLTSSLLRYESVRPEKPVDGDPLGPGLRGCLDFAMECARARGMTVRSHEGQVAVAEIGDGEENVAVVIHLDTVPAAGDWSHPPFAGIVADGEVWGRGAQDDKGPLASVLCALDALAAENTELRRRVTLVLGTDEESGLWRDLAAFHRHEPMPTMAIIPDGDFPVVSAEKGFANIVVRVPSLGEPDGGIVLRSLTAGVRANVVPERAEAVVGGLDVDYLAARADAFALSHSGARIEVCAEGDYLRITANGTPTHASTPEKGRSALLDLAGLLAPEPFRRNAAEGTLRFLERWIGNDLHGERLGVFRHDAFMGFCTVCVGKVSSGPTGDTEMWLNLRPVHGQTLADVHECVSRRAAELGHELGVPYEVVLDRTSMEPLYVPEDSELVRGLSAAFEDATGQPARPVSIGGTTFAKAFRNAVAFGPGMPDDPQLAHERDERVSIDALVRNAGIYALALDRLAGAAEDE